MAGWPVRTAIFFPEPADGSGRWPSTTAFLLISRRIRSDNQNVEQGVCRYGGVAGDVPGIGGRG